jgi:hypothetical protein
MKIISEPTLTSKSLKNTNINSDPSLVSKFSEKTNIIYSPTTSTYLANREIISSTQTSITLDNEENNLKGFLNDVSLYVYIGILVVLLISLSTFASFINIYLCRKR